MPDPTTVLVTVELLLGLVILGLGIRSLSYFAALWRASKSTDDPDRSYLLAGILRMLATLTAGSAYFLLTLTLNLIFGTIFLLRPVSALVIVILLTQPYLFYRKFDGDTRDRIGILDGRPRRLRR